MLARLRHVPKKIIATSRLWLGRNSVVLRWATEGVIAENWGDKLNPYLAQRISGKSVIHRQDIYPFGAMPVYYWIGSHLATACCDPRAIVWGAGFISTDIPIRGSPRQIHAVRGWLSNERLREAGIKAPDVVGDAALLLPRFYKPQGKYDKLPLGIIPHCLERDLPFFDKAREWDDARVIDICGDIQDVVEQIVACERVASSSLHGIICADAYGVPAVWLNASDRPKGDGFKFKDYFSSVGRSDPLPYEVRSTTTRSELERQFFDYEIDIDLDALWQTCPLLNCTVKQQ